MGLSQGASAAAAELGRAQAVFGQGATSRVPRPMAPRGDARRGHTATPQPNPGAPPALPCPGTAAAFTPVSPSEGAQQHQDLLFILNCKLFNWKGTMEKNKCARVDFHV